MRIPALVALVLIARAASAATLESSTLSLQVTEAPYSFRVVERSTGEILLRQSATTFTMAGSSAGAASASAVVTTATTLDADLTLGGAGTAHVRFTFTTPQVLKVALTAMGSTQIQEQFEDQQEHVYGIWEYPWSGGLDNRGQEHPYLGVGQNTGSLYTSGRAPFYVTSRRYGIYAETDAEGQYSVASGGRTGFWFRGPSLSYHVIYGPRYLDVLARYAAIAGGPPVPPLWALDTIYWEDDFHRDLHNATNAQGNVLDLATQLQDRRIHASGVLVDRPYGTGDNGWGNMDFDGQFPDPDGMVSGLHARGLNLILWVANRAWNGLYTDGKASDYLFPGSATLGPAVDLRLTPAYTWLEGRLDPLAKLAHGYKIDRGEQGEHPDSVQNQNVTLFARLTQHGLAVHHPDEAFVISRNVADTGRQFTAVWNGDTRSDFTGLAYSVAAGLRSGAVMMPVWGSDTGGYLRGGGGPSEEVFARWYGFSAYSPIMEVLVGDDHTPWYDYSAALVAIARKHGDTHHDLMPYTRSMLYAASKTGAPVLRPLFFVHDDAAAVNLADQYLYGSELLVAPVLQAGALTRSVYLPAGGKWVEYNGRLEVVNGGATVQAAAPLDTIPAYAREGAIIPRGELYRGNDNWTAGWAPALRIELFPSATTASRFDYFTGAEVRPITAAKASGRLTIQFGDLGLAGKLDVYLLGFTSVTRNGVKLSAADYSYSSASHLLSVAFTGATTLEIDGAASIFGPGNEATPDAGADAGADAAPDAGIDAAPDAGPDAGADAGPDAAPDVAADAAADRAVADAATRPDGRDAGAVEVGPQPAATLDASLLPDAPPVADAAVVPSTAGGSSGGCSCSTGTRAAGRLQMMPLALALLVALRRRQRG